MRTLWIASFVLLSCEGAGPSSSPFANQFCLERDLSLWCYHQYPDGPQTPPNAPPCEAPEDLNLEPDSFYEGVLSSVSGPGFSGVDHYFSASTGQHIATKFWTDTDSYCGGFTFWYGEHLR
ncbi:MAG: hypothetical protein AAGA48_11130 [Myxococcota bacterium]